MSVVINTPPWYRRLANQIKGYDGWFLLALLLLCSVGMLAMYSSGYDHGTRFVTHGRNMLLAFGVMLVFAHIPPQRLLDLAIPIFAVGVILLFAVEFFGITKKGATRWINVGLVIQPSEIMKVAVPLMLAWWFHHREGQLRILDFSIAFMLLGVPVGLIMLQPDLGTSLLVLASGLAVIYFAGLSWKLIIPPVVLAVIGIGLLIAFEPQLCAKGVRWVVLHDYQQQRICTLLDPFKDPLGKGFHVIQGMIAIGAGGITGMGFMQGTQTHLEFIPERTTDFIFATFAEEYGLLGALLLLALYTFLIARAFYIALQAPTLFSRLLAASLSTIFFTYAFVNLGMVSGILPVVGVPLPFISYGGTAMITLGMISGMLLSISKSRRMIQS